MRVMYVEDDPRDIDLLLQVLQADDPGVEVRTAGSVADARIMLEAAGPDYSPYDVLVADIGLPDGNGFNVVDWLRKQENLARLPLVVYSGRELTPDECRQLTLGPTHFLTKARVQPQQLEALVLTMLRSSRQMEEIPVAGNPR